jgi:uncharacterized protein DUF4157
MRQHKGQGSERQPETSVQRKAAGSPGKSTLIAHGDAVQLHATGGAAADSTQVHAHAERGVAGAGAALPHLDRIQHLFGRHDVSAVQAHTGGEAAGACEAIGASAYATGNQVAFAGQPSLHTAAHEAAHVVQQRGGVQLKGGVGQAGDAYEHHADAVADKVVAGESAEPLLDTMAGGGAQMAVQRAQPISETTDTGNRYTQELEVLPSKIQIQLAVEWVKQGTWASDAAFQTFIRQCKTTVYGYLDNKFKIVGTPKPSSGAQAWERPIEVLLYDSSGYRISVYGGTNGGCSMAQAGGTIYEQTVTGAPQDPVTIAHEFGHALLGQSDEYANPAVPGRVISNDHSMMGNYKTQGRAQAEFKVRHFQHILAAVAPQFPNHTCTLVKV